MAAMTGCAGRIAAALLAMSFAATASAGQGVEGPLGEPGPPQTNILPPHSTGKPARKPRRHAARGAVARHAQAAADPLRDAFGDAAPPEAAPPVPPTAPRAHHAAAPVVDDPVSLGFKWQGSNDTAEKTRVQNYGGDAAGTGAAVGLKLHF